jgi:hypothetical protein
VICTIYSMSTPSSFHAYTQRGVSLIEVVIGVSILATVLWGIVAAFGILLERGFEQEARIKAALLMEEGFEGMRFVRDGSWDAFAELSIDTPLALTIGSGIVTATTSTSTILIDGRFARTLTLREVYRRDSDAVIVPVSDPAAKTLDEDARLLEVAVSWDAGAGSIEGTMLFTNLFQ